MSVRIGVVGMNYWGPNLARNFARLPGAELAWCCDLDPDLLDRHRGAHPSTRFTTQYADLLDDPDLDAIAIATSVPTHAALAKRSLEAGKHTFVEKPLAPSSELADELFHSAAAEGLVLMCGHTFLYSAPVRRVKELLELGELGELYFVSSSRVNLGLHQRDTSVIWDLGPHDFSILLYWLGELPEKVRAVGRDSVVPGIPDVAFVTLTFPSGLVANVELSWLAPSKLRRTVVVGSEKMVVYEDGGPEAVKIFDHGVVYRDPETFGEYHLSYRTGDVLAPKLDSTEPLRVELLDFVAAIRDGVEPTADVDLARHVVRLTEAADASLKEMGAEIQLRRQRRFVPA
jgi:predicted dehydrogenase